jgi:hypothetical protein
MTQYTVTVTVDLDDAPKHNSLVRVREIAEVIEDAVLQEFTADNDPTSVEAKFRYDRKDGPFVNAVTVAHAAPAQQKAA